jgi:hypothetical protein
MRKALFAIVYTLGLSVFFPLLIINHRSSAALPMFFAPIVAAVFAEVLARSFRFTKEKSENRVIWLVAAFILLAQAAKYALKLEAIDGFIEYLALNALYQIVLILIFSSSETPAPTEAGAGSGPLFRLWSSLTGR